MKHNLTKKTWLLMAALMLVLTVTVGGTLAYLIDSTDSVTNVFTPTSIPTKVEENVGTNAKANVTIKNEGNATAYVRAQIIVTWQDENGNVYSVKPVEGADKDYTISIGSNWELDSATGFYYYNSTVVGGGNTTNLIDTCTILVTANPPDGYKLHVEIIAQAIQAEGLPEGVDTAKEAFAEASAE